MLSYLPLGLLRHAATRFLPFLFQGDNVPLRPTQPEALETRGALFVASVGASASTFSSLDRERKREREEGNYVTADLAQLHPGGSSRACRDFEAMLNMTGKKRDVHSSIHAITTLLIKTILLCFHFHDLFMCVCAAL